MEPVSVNVHDVGESVLFSNTTNLQGRSTTATSRASDKITKGSFSLPLQVKGKTTIKMKNLTKI